MQLQVTRVEKSCLFSRFLMIVILEFGLSVAYLAWAPAARAQVASLEPADGEISGTVVLEPDKRPASHVAVSLKSRVAGVFWSVLTYVEGRFKVQNLPHGTYEVAVDEAGVVATQFLL